jgi:ABC-2 type transport system permease protein
MNWHVIARTDVRRSVNQRGIWALVGGFLFGFGGLAALILYVGDPNFQGYIELLKAGAGLLVPLAGIVLGYESIIGEQESVPHKASSASCFCGLSSVSKRLY